MLTSTHWGTYRARVEGGKLVGLDSVPWDRNPSPIGQSIVDGVTAPNRVRRPAIREGFLRGRGASRERRGCEPFVEVSWDEAVGIVAAELARVKAQFGNDSIFGGSYGWSSAGRFHHAQSQVHRFLNTIGGYTYFKDTYSSGAARRVLPHVVGDMDDLRKKHTAWASLAAQLRDVHSLRRSSHQERPGQCRRRQRSCGRGLDPEAEVEWRRVCQRQPGAPRHRRHSGRRVDRRSSRQRHGIGIGALSRSDHRKSP